MKKRDSKEPSELKKLGKWAEWLIAVGFALGVLILVSLFLYVLATQFFNS